MERIRSTRALVAAAVAGAVVGVAVAPQAGSAHFQTGLYSHKRGDCASRIDPVGAVFYRSGTVANAQTHTWHHAGWGQTVIENGQYFATHGICYFQQIANANGQVWESRDHMRMRQTYHADATYGTTTVGTPHYDVRVDCGHAVRYTSNGVSGYDLARNRLANAMAAGHSTYYTYWGNTQQFVQCNGWIANSNGNVRYFRI